MRHHPALTPRHTHPPRHRTPASPPRPGVVRTPSPPSNNHPPRPLRSRYAIKLSRPSSNGVAWPLLTLRQAQPVHPLEPAHCGWLSTPAPSQVARQSSRWNPPVVPAPLLSDVPDGKRSLGMANVSPQPSPHPPFPPRASPARGYYVRRSFRASPLPPSPPASLTPSVPRRSPSPPHPAAARASRQPLIACPHLTTPQHTPPHPLPLPPTRPAIPPLPPRASRFASSPRPRPRASAVSPRMPAHHRLGPRRGNRPHGHPATCPRSPSHMPPTSLPLPSYRKSTALKRVRPPAHTPAPSPPETPSNRPADPKTRPKTYASERKMCYLFGICLNCTTFVENLTT